MNQKGNGVQHRNRRACSNKKARKNSGFSYWRKPPVEVAFLLNKYRVHEVAKDFGKNSKEISDILTKYATTPKNHMQVLEDRELSLIFEYLTQHNQVESIESIFADVYREPKPAQPAKQEMAAPAGKGAPAGQTPADPAAGPAAPQRQRRSGAGTKPAAPCPEPGAAAGQPPHHPGAGEKDCGHPQGRRCEPGQIR